MTPTIAILIDILIAAPDLVAKVRDLILGSPGATPAELLERLKQAKVEQAIQESEWAKDLSNPQE